MFFLKKWKEVISKTILDEDVGVKAILCYLMMFLLSLLVLPFFILKTLLFPLYYVFTRIKILFEIPFAKKWIEKNLADKPEEKIMDFYRRGSKLVKKDHGWILNTYNKKLYKHLKEVMAKKNLPSLEDEL